MNTYYVRPMDLHTWIETCQEKCTAVVTLKDHEAEVQKLKDLGQRIDDELVAAQRSLAAFQYPPDHRVSVAERERDEAESRLDKLFESFGLKPGELSDEEFTEHTQWILNAAGAFDKIHTARCKLEDDGNDEVFFEAMSEALEEHGLEPQPCPMCNRYGPHGHTI